MGFLNVNKVDEEHGYRELSERSLVDAILVPSPPNKDINFSWDEIISR